MKRYENYKPSGVEFIGDIPEHWEVKKLKYCMRDKITDGPHETPKFISEGIPFLSVDGIQNGELVFENCRKISEEAHKEYSKKALIEYDDILLGKAASIGKIARVKVDFEFSIWSPLALIKANKEVVLPTFLEYSLKTKMVQYQIETLATNNTQKNISMADIPRFILTIPTLSEQKKIATFLDIKNKQIEEFIKEKQHQISLLKEQKEAIINQAVTKGLDDSVKMKDSGIEWIGNIPKTWGLCKLKYISKKISDGIHSTPVYTDGSKYYFINGNNLNNGQIKITNNTRSVNYFEFVKHKRELNNQTILISINGTIGNLAFYNNELVILGKSSAYINLNEEINKMFIYLVLQANYVKDFFELEYTGSTIKNISLATIKAIPIPIPSKMEQRRIVEFIEVETSKIDKIIKQIQREIDLIKEYKISLISEVVTGQIDVR